MNKIRFITLSLILVGLLSFRAPPAHATLVTDGLQYNLTETQTFSSGTANFTLSIVGINGPETQQGGRIGILALAFTRPLGYRTAVAPDGFALRSGGLAANGCNGKGNFFCFSALTAPKGILACESTLSFTFSLDAARFTGYAPDFKIHWAGTHRHYDLVSRILTPTIEATVSTGKSGTNVPEPAIFSVLLFGLITFMLLHFFGRKPGRFRPIRFKSPT